LDSPKSIDGHADNRGKCVHSGYVDADDKANQLQGDIDVSHVDGCHDHDHDHDNVPNGYRGYAEHSPWPGSQVFDAITQARLGLFGHATRTQLRCAQMR
jgi:hypothetical protein